MPASAASSRFLRNVPVLADLGDGLLDRLASEATDVVVRAGEWLLREGDEADSLFIVRSGRVEIIDEGPPAALIRVLRRGDVVGELALLRRGVRSTSVRARRDTELVRLTRTAFEHLIEEAPSFALGLTRSLGAQLAASRTPVAVPAPPQAIAIVGLDPAAHVAQVTERLRSELAHFGSVEVLDGGDVGTIERAERDS